MMRTLVLLCISQHTKFEVPISPIPKIRLGQNLKKKRVMWPWPRPFAVIKSQSLDIFYLHTKFGDCRFSHSGDGSRDTVHAPLGVVCHSQLLYDIIYLYKIYCSSTAVPEIWLVPTTWPRPLQG